ncbi:MAG TPA: hypothetical protein VMJ64_09990 [Anaerolineales bacterium]|nr:hypothetical protein [Anaerolineales bacterium]
MTDFYLWPGFLGTRATFGPDIALVLVLISSAMLTVGWQLAVHQHYDIHRWVQTSAASINAIAVLAIMVGSFLGFVLPDIPAQIGQPVTFITTVHAVIGTIAFLLGVFVVLRANKLVPKAWRFKNYKLFMRTSYALYMLTTLIGIGVYLVTYLWTV